MRYSVLILCTFLSTSLYSQLYIYINDLPESTHENPSVYMAGNINHWNPSNTEYRFKKDQNDQLYLVIDSLEIGEMIQYKFTLGSWDLVETEWNGVDVSNREYLYENSDTIYVSIAAWNDTSIPVEQINSASYNVEIISDTFYMPSLNRYRRIWVYLPPDYDIEEDTQYPVLYMHDGQNLFDNATSFSGEWKVDETLNELFEEGAIVPIVIGIDHGSQYRLSEYCVEDYIGENEKIMADGSNYLAFINTTLKPYVDRHFRTKSDKEFTGIMGSSLGGLISTYAILQHSDIYGLAGLFSSSYWLSDSIYSTPFSHEPPNRIYSLCGSKEEASTVENIEHMTESFRKNYSDTSVVKMEIIEGGEHNEKLWSESFKASILFLYN